jgi:hypothetical protein
MSNDFSTSQTRTFISKLNPESPPFEPSSYYQHIQEASQPKISSGNHLHIQPITNGHQDNQNYYSTTIQRVEPSEHVAPPTHFIQETIPHNQYSTVSSHIQPVNIPIEEEENKEEDITNQSTSFNTEASVNEKLDELK